MKQTKVTPLTFKDEKEVADFEQRIRRAHNQIVIEELPKDDPDPSWWKRGPPGILKKIIPVLLPPNRKHKKGKT